MSKDWTGGTASIFKTIGASNHCDHEREKNDYYATSPIATELLCSLEEFSPNILEPCCGEGHISKVLMAHGYNVVSRDLIERGFGEGGHDFLLETEPFDGDVVTNPPYKYAQQFVEKALSIIPEGRKLAMFLKLTFLEGKARRAMFETTPPCRIWVSSSRLGCALNGDFEHTEGSATAYAWFIWEKGYKGAPEIHWFN